MRATVTGVGVLDKSMSIVDAVESTPLTASELADALDSNLSTTHRLAMALVEHGLLARDREGRFRPGMRFDSNRLAIAARPVLMRLRDATSETAQLWARRGDSRVCLESADAPHELRVTLPSGWVLPLAGGGSAGHVLSGAAVGEHGWFEAIAERTAGLGSVSAPVRLGDEVVAAVCLGVPLARVSSTPGAQWGALVVEAADELAALLRR